jgi:hypothetical protein
MPAQPCQSFSRVLGQGRSGQACCRSPESREVVAPRLAVRTDAVEQAVYRLLGCLLAVETRVVVRLMLGRETGHCQRRVRDTPPAVKFGFIERRHVPSGSSPPRVSTA